jgi:CRP-like cAMP-binding protein
MPSEHLSALKSMSLCRALSPAELDAIAAIVDARDVAAGAELFREGEPGDALYMVVQGEVDIVKRGPSGERSLARLGPGSVLGEMSLITSEARSATARATTALHALRVPAQRFRASMQGGSAAALKITAAIAEVLAQRLANMNSVVLELAEKTANPAAARSALKTQDLAELHRKMQVWSI